MFKRLSITFRTIAFVAIVCGCLILIDGWSSWSARSVQLKEMGAATSNLARAMAQHADHTIKEADTALIGIVERTENDGIGPVAIERLQRFLEIQVTELPQLNGLFIYDENGGWIANSKRELAKNLNNADREYFVFHRTHAARGPHVGTPVTSRSGGKWIIPVSRRINHGDGSFAGVALATIEIDFLMNFFESLEIGKAGSVALVSEGGTMMARRPNYPSTVGKSMLTTQLFRAYSSEGPAGTAYITSAQDGVTRLNSFRRLPNYPLFVAAALSKDEILTAWWQDTLWHLGGVICFVAVIAFVGGRLTKQIDLRTKAEAEVVRARDALESLNKTLQRLAMQDGLTGLANRRQFDATLGDEFSRAMRNASTLALILMDVDCFKQYNDIYGHAAGDACLQTISRTIAELTPRRPGDLAARYGGEELVVLLPNTDVAGAVAVAEKICNAIRNLGIEHIGNAGGFVTLSAGVDALIPIRGSHKPAELIQAADKALYAAKAAGRNRVCVNTASELA